jgi:hypothetical protein
VDLDRKAFIRILAEYFITKKINHRGICTAAIVLIAVLLLGCITVW